MGNKQSPAAQLQAIYKAEADRHRRAAEEAAGNQQPALTEPTQEPAYDPGPSYASYEAPAPVQLDSDPGWLGLMAELDRQGGMYDAEAGRKRGLVTSDRDRLLGELEPRGELEREGIQGGYEARGLFGGGAMATAVARQRANQERRATSIGADAAARVSDIEGQLALQKAELERQRSTARMDYLSRGYA